MYGYGIPEETSNEHLQIIQYLKEANQLAMEHLKQNKITEATEILTQIENSLKIEMEKGIVYQDMYKIVILTLNNISLLQKKTQKYDLA
jgi:tetratricopeptide (TPR) repeat protein